MTTKWMIAGAAALLAGAGLATGVSAGTAAAQPCSNAVVFGNGGGRCDSAPAADGSFQRCDTVYVLGIGGTNCYMVPGGPPPAG
ncbi:hypothetical protein FK535_17190 [Mycolicibacterium sp. 018/SC-01/001]|uniref:CDGP domain-containing protein n=1 Tax=Mycolicibacterium sp. 018/SC-01/001 TaxID=2592069 RepID=UPI00117EBF9A|nr:hypothetical protein [Mycolicibacterium sp. 018/SC-01/001]TRW81196.1 hypothetical protein FK535_17190 [Mycolicibacterium sp. 018/SC-01/001]